MQILLLAFYFLFFSYSNLTLKYTQIDDLENNHDQTQKPNEGCNKIKLEAQDELPINNKKWAY